MPAYWRQKSLVIHFAAYKDHLSIFPGQEAAIEHFASRLAGWKTSKGTWQVPYEEPLPLALIQEIAQWCAASGNPG